MGCSREVEPKGAREGRGQPSRSPLLSLPFVVRTTYAFKESGTRSVDVHIELSKSVGVVSDSNSIDAAKQSEKRVSSRSEGGREGRVSSSSLEQPISEGDLSFLLRLSKMGLLLRSLQ